MSDRHRTLVLLRHAKSDYPDGVVDHDRPLAPRGVREGALAGDWIRANVGAVDAVLCSTATRTRQTLERTGITAPVQYVDRIYDATPGIVIEEINAAPSRFGDAVSTLLVIGHEPVMSSLARGVVWFIGRGSFCGCPRPRRRTLLFPRGRLPLLKPPSAFPSSQGHWAGSNLTRSVEL